MVIITKSEFFFLLIMHHIVSAALIMTVFFGSSMIASAFRMHSRGSSSKLFQRRFLAVDMKNPQVYFGECEFANSIFSIYIVFCLNSICSIFISDIEIGGKPAGRVQFELFEVESSVLN